MRNERWIAGLMLLCAAGPTTGPTTAPTTLPTTAPATLSAVDPGVAALLQQLDADDWQARDAAAAKLLAMGEVVRPVIADAASLATSPEVRSRAAGVIAKLNQIAAERPTLVTLHYAAGNPRKMLADLAKQAGVPIRAWPDYLWTGQFGPVPKVTMDVTDQPFWMVLDDFCKRAGCRVQRMGNGEELTVMQGGGGDGPLAGRHTPIGRFTVVAKSFDHQRSVSYTDGTNSSNDSLSFEVLLDPKVRLAASTPSVVELLEGTDDRGTSLLPAAGGSPEQLADASGSVASFTMSVAPAGAGATRITVLRGRLKAAVIARAERMVIDDIGHAGQVTRVVGPYTVDLQQASVAGREVSYTLVVHGAGRAMGHMMHREFRLEDQAGEPITGGGSTSSGGMADRRTFQAHVTAAEPIKGPVRLVWDVTTETKVVTVPFEFRDLPLPPP